MPESIFFTGSYTKQESPVGIRACALDTGTGKVRVLHQIEAPNPSYLCFSDDRKFVFSAYETSQFDGSYGGAAACRRINPDYSVEFVSHALTRGRAPCHVSLSADGKVLFAANYSDGSVLFASVGANGELSERNFIQHEGSSVTPRQTGPHAHFAREVNGVLYVCDLGIDKVMAYRSRDGYKTIEALTPITLPPGAGPRHFYADDGRFFYVLSELSCEVFVYELSSGAFALRQQLPTCDLGAGKNSCAAITASPCGNWLLASNRGFDTLRVFRRGGDGLLTDTGAYPCGGRTPRDFAFDPSGKFILCANQDSGNLSVLSFDAANGAIGQVGSVEMNAPVCVKFVV